MLKNTNRFWIAVLLLGWAFDFLFWGHEPGISFAIYVALTVATGLLLLNAEGHRPARWSLVLLAPVAFFAVMTFWRTEPMTLFISYVLALLMLAIFAVTYLGGRWILYSLADYISRAFQLTASVVTAAAVLAFSKPAPQPGAEPEGQKTGVGTSGAVRQFWSVLRGVLIAIPIIAIFAALLSSADLVFASRLNDLLKVFSLENLPEYIFRIIYILVLAYALAGVFLHAAKNSSDEKLSGLDKPPVRPFFGFTEAAVVLGSVVALFAFFVVIQFQYFFGGQANIGVEGYTFAEYARRGFGELVTVAFFSLILFLGLSAITRRESPVQRRIFIALGIGLVALVFIMLLSAYYRLMLYEQAYGFSRLRTYTHVFMIWLAVLLAVTVILDVMQRQRAFALAAMLALVGFAVSLCLVNVDAFIVNHNVERVKNGFDLDVAYLTSLSADAVPPLASWYGDETLDQNTRDMLGASLACINAQTSYGDLQAWQSFNMSTRRAGQALKTLDLSGYKYNDNRQDENGYWLPPAVTTPLGNEHPCIGYTTAD
jgi:hypothetical protein